MVLLDVAGLAALLRKSESWVYKRTAERAIPYTTAGRKILFTEAHVAQILAAGEQPTATAPSVSHIRTRRVRRTAA